MSDVRIKRPQADLVDESLMSDVRPQNLHSDVEPQDIRVCAGFAPNVATAPTFRITEDGQLRITENDFNRII